MYENDITFLKRVTRATPPHFFGQPTAQNDRSQLLEFFLPLFGFSEVEINLGILAALSHSIQAIMVSWSRFGRLRKIQTQDALRLPNEPPQDGARPIPGRRRARARQ